MKAGERLKAIPEAKRPAKVIVLILTDGYENSSREYTKSKVKEMVEHQRSVYRWEFVYLGANVDAFAEAGSMGMSLDAAATYRGTPTCVAAAYHVASAAVSRSRRGGTSDLTDEERKKLAGDR